MGVESERGHFEGSREAGEGGSLSISIITDPSYEIAMRELGRSERTGSGAGTGTIESMFVTPAVYRSTGEPALRDGFRALETHVSTEGDRPIELPGPHGSRRYRYGTPEVSGMGINQVDVDNLGVVRSFAFIDSRGRRVAIADDRLAQLLLGRDTDGWKATRQGSGVEAITTVTAPDGRTIYQLDNLRRLVSDVGRHHIAPPRGMLAFPSAAGTRYESAGMSGEVRSARVSPAGDFISLTVRSSEGDRQLIPGDWAQLTPGGSVSLGGLWWASRGDFGGRLPADSIRLAHPDGTAYYLSPQGRLLHFHGPNETRRIPMGPHSDLGTRFITADRAHTGSLSIDVDDLGILRGLSHKDTAGRTLSLDMTLLDKIPADGQPHKLQGGWTVSRTGSGVHGITEIIAPDARTQFRLDGMGRLISGTGSLSSSPRSEFTVRDLQDGSRRHDSVMMSGIIAGAVVSPDGALAEIALIGRTHTTTITRTEWIAALRGNGSVREGWWASRVNSAYAEAHGIPHDSIRIANVDGTTYHISPSGRFLGGLASTMTRRRAQTR